MRRMERNEEIIESEGAVVLQSCEGCGHLVKTGIAPTCDYLLHTGKVRSGPVGKDACPQYTEDQSWKEVFMGMKVNGTNSAKPVMAVKPQAPARAVAPEQSKMPTNTPQSAEQNVNQGMTVDQLVELLTQGQAAGLGKSLVYAAGAPLPYTEDLSAKIKKDGVVIELVI